MEVNPLEHLSILYLENGNILITSYEDIQAGIKKSHTNLHSIYDKE